MPSPKGPQLRAKIMEVWNADKTLSGKQIGERVGCSPSTALYHIKKIREASGEVLPAKLKGGRPKKNTWNKTDPKVERQVMNYRVAGMHVTDIARKVGVNAATVYRIMRDSKKNNSAMVQSLVKQHQQHHPANRELAGRELADRVAELKATGLGITAIAKQLGKHKSTIYSATHYWKNHPREKGEIVQHGHVNGNTNGHAANAPTKAELIGFAWAHVERGITDIASRSSLPPEVLRRRLSELLGYTAIR
jgi:transposase